MNNQKNKSIGKKIKFGYLLIIALFLVITIAVTLTSLYFNSIYNETITSIIKASQLQEMSAKDYDKLRNAVVDIGADYDNTEVLKEMQSNISYLQSVTPSDDSNLSSRVSSVSALVKAYEERSTKVVNGVKNKKPGSISPLVEALEETRKVSGFINTEVKELIILQLNHSQKIMDNIRTQSTILVISITALFVLIVLFALVYSMKLSGKISKGLSILTNAAKTLSDADFSGKDIAVNTNDELDILAETFNVMKNNIKDISKRVVEAGFVIYSASSELKKGVNTLYESSSQVAEAIHDVAGTAESQCVSLHNHSKIVEDTFNLSSELQNSLNRLEISDSKISDELKEISVSLKSLIENISKMNSAGKHISELSTRFAANSEEIAAATDEQLSIHKALLDTASKLDTSSQELEVLIKNLKTSL